MEALSYLRKIYDLDTLDTRFTSSSSTPYQAVIDARSNARADKETGTKNSFKTQPPKWNTPEFWIYYLILGVVIPYMFWVAYDASKTTSPQFQNYSHLLSPGWIPGRQIDISDTQYRTFRGNIPYMGLLLVFHPLLRRAYNFVFFPKVADAQSPRPTFEEADMRLNQRTSFDFGFAMIFLIALHGVSSLKVLLILYLNYHVATSLPRKYVPVATWIFNIGILFANDLCNGYRLGDVAAWVHGGYVPSVDSPEPFLVSWGRWLDSYGGIMSRWEILFNITVLRLISFNMDYYWSLDRRSYSPLEVSSDNNRPFPATQSAGSAHAPKKKQVDVAALSERDRVSIPAQAKDYSMRNYIAYAIYAPLYLTGPILTFNDYISQQRYKPATIELSRTVKYSIRFALTLLAMEVILHYDYVQAIAKARPNWGDYTPMQLSLLSYFNLHMIWLKLLLPWRLFRLWALADGVDPPENMMRCVSDNYSTLSFWRAWHRSYNRWLTRYIYVPLGGSSFKDAASSARSVANYVLTFTFVALWHDIKLHLLIWGWLVVFFMLPEMAARALFPARRWEASPTAYRMISCVGAVGNVLMMMMANLVGFAVGLDGLQKILAGIFRDMSGIVFLVTACSVLFMGVQIMFEIRESELRRGISLKC